MIILRHFAFILLGFELVFPAQAKEIYRNFYNRQLRIGRVVSDALSLLPSGSKLARTMRATYFV
jgi:hypothetical protein